MMVIELMAETATHASSQPWPPLEWAGWIFDRASVALAASLIVGAIATVAIVWMGIVKEHHWDLLREHANQKIALVELDAAKSNAEAARANEAAGVLKEETARLAVEAEKERKETALAQLQLEQMRFPRRLNSEKLKNEVKDVPPQLFEVLYDQSAPDGPSLAFEIFVTLLSIEWKTDQALPAPLKQQPGPPGLGEVYQLLPLTQQHGASPWGVSVVTKGPINEDETKPERVLFKALLASVASPVPTVGHGKDETMPAKKIRIVVSPKLP